MELAFISAIAPSVLVLGGLILAVWCFLKEKSPQPSRNQNASIPEPPHYWEKSPLIFFESNLGSIYMTAIRPGYCSIVLVSQSSYLSKGLQESLEELISGVSNRAAMIYGVTTPTKVRLSDGSERFKRAISFRLY